MISRLLSCSTPVGSLSLSLSLSLSSLSLSLMSGIPVPAVVMATVDVIAVVTIALTSARFLGDRSQDRIVSAPEELTEEGNIVRRSEDLRGAGIAARIARIGDPSLSHFPPHSTSR